MSDPDPLRELSTPALLRGARRAYGRTIRAELDAGGCDDVPANGIFVLGAIARGGVPLGEIIAALRLSKQAAGALVDTLVTRGYLDRTPDPADRRRLIVALTPRGEAAAEIVRRTVDAVDAQLLARVGAEALGRAREVLAALAAMGDADA